MHLGESLVHLDSISVWKLVKTRNLNSMQTIECIIDIHLFELVMTGLSNAFHSEDPPTAHS